MSDIPVITVDGPSGSGKGTLSRWLAHKLKWHLLDSGSLYRLVALKAIRSQLEVADEAKLAEEARHLDVIFDAESGADLLIFLDDEDVSLDIRAEKCGLMASKVAAIAAVREALYERQQAFRQPPGLVADGRDMGTVVFPQAQLKIFLTANVETRAQRRYKQLNQKGISANLAALLDDIKTRDERDSNRAASPLKPATDAVILDTTDMSIEHVCEVVLIKARERLS